MSETLALFWTMIGTCVAAVGTVGTLIYAVASGNRLRKDALDENRISQARKVFAWFEEISGDVVLGNSSDEPVYEVVCYLVWVQEASPRTGEDAEEHFRKHGLRPMRAILPVLPPGDFRMEINTPTDWPKGMAHLGVELAFVDSANRSWVRRGSFGGLRRLASAPTVHYAISPPHHYSTLQERGVIEGS